MLPSLRRSASALLLLCAPALAGAQPSGPTIGGERGRPSEERVGTGWLERRWAESDLERLAAAVEEHERLNGRLPTGAGFEAVAPGLLESASPVDPWGRPYRLVIGERRAVLSSGPDRSPGTGDDLVRLLGGASAPPSSDPASAPPRAAAPVDFVEGEVLATHSRMLTLSGALESFRRQRGHYPVGLDGDGLAEALVPEHLPAGDFAPVDGWGRPWRYRSNDVGSSYTLVSAGSDGRHESLVPLRSGPVRGAERDLVVVDGAFARWPAGVSARAAGLGGAAAPEPRAEPSRPAAPPPAPEPRRVRRGVEPGKDVATSERLERIAAALKSFRNREGRYPELDDAGRLMSLLGLRFPAQDAWGRDLAYLSLASGSRSVIASRGADGRLDHSLEEYLRGARPSGDDLVWLNARPVR